LEWGEPTFDSGVVKKCHRLYRLPLNDFTREDLRLMIGQQIGLAHLVPLALELLAVEPLISGECYEGDLLAAVLRADSRFWSGKSELRSLASWLALTVLSDSHGKCLDESQLQAHEVFLRAEYFTQHGRA